MARLDQVAAQIALRTRAATLSVCTTGSTTLGQDANGFTRLTGSFITDGFFQGMEITPSGFTDTTRRIVSGVSALGMSVVGGLSVDGATAGRTLSVGLPQDRRYEMRDADQPDELRHYLEEEWVPRPIARRSFPADGATMIESALWVLRWYGLPGYDAFAIRKCVSGVLDLFTPGTTIAAGAHTLIVGGGDGNPGGVTGVAPQAGQILRSGSHAVCPITIPVWAFTTNVVAA